MGVSADRACRRAWSAARPSTRNASPFLETSAAGNSSASKDSITSRTMVSVSSSRSSLIARIFPTWLGETMAILQPEWRSRNLRSTSSSILTEMGTLTAPAVQDVQFGNYPVVATLRDERNPVALLQHHDVAGEAVDACFEEPRQGSGLGHGASPWRGGQPILQPGASTRTHAPGEMTLKPAARAAVARRSSYVTNASG